MIQQQVKLLSISAFILFTFGIFDAHAQTNLFPDINNLYMLSNARSRSISPENFTGEKGKGGMIELADGSAQYAARELGKGWKVNPFVIIKPGETFTLGEVKESGIINHIWMTPIGDYRLSIFRIFWDDEEHPSVETPVGDFFCSGWGLGNEPKMNSMAICVNPYNGFNSYWQMPFRKKCKITMENKSDKDLRVYYQIDYTLTEVPEEAAYFHAQFRRVNPLPYKEVYTIVDNIKGKGQYVGTYLAHGANSPGWWGEGEIKFFIDGDGEFPTINGTGEEDYFNGSYGYEDENEQGVRGYTNFHTPYSGFYHVKKSGVNLGRFGQYRWHIFDPIRFENDLRITIQSLGWKSNGAYLPLEDDLASVAYWYQTEPHQPFPALPSKEDLLILYNKPVDHLAKGKAIQIDPEPTMKYGSNVDVLLDGNRGNLDFNDGNWRGFEGNDFEAIIDLGQKKDILEISTGFLSQHGAWIFFPEKIELFLSENGVRYKAVGEINYKIEEHKDGNTTKDFTHKLNKGHSARYIKIKAKNIGKCPSWHPGNGGDAWIFIDEVIIK
ncbi:DUF2961 domain-containing protein [Fulvivirgaceae bacterium BMA10]|uniref:DUF2961 domain-containing protein n=1 Tax=Splendidivirga corallicola TaxID=3051826 RepID=A0ABT8KL85_9BACT|nr:DUF2961 domain-containing protein [Fulvivirgaceae bacterium BMA10]